MKQSNKFGYHLKIRNLENDKTNLVSTLTGLNLSFVVLIPGEILESDKIGMKTKSNG